MSTSFFYFWFLCLLLTCKPFITLRSLYLCFDPFLFFPSNSSCFFQFDSNLGTEMKICGDFLLVDMNSVLQDIKWLLVQILTWVNAIFERLQLACMTMSARQLQLAPFFFSKSASGTQRLSNTLIPQWRILHFIIVYSVKKLTSRNFM